MDSRYFVVLVATNLIPLSAITVPPLCPTNKIAPHRRSNNLNRPRTFGSFGELLSANGPDQGPSSLVETPEEDDPEDCGFIEDYDENDLSSLSPQSQRRGHSDSRLFFNNFFRPTSSPVRPGDQQNYPNRPGQFYPMRPEHPNYPVRPDHQPIYPGPGYPGNQPGYPVNQPAYPGNQPSNPVNQPGYPANQPGYPGNQPGYPVNQPSYPVRPPRPQYTTQRPGRPTRPPYGSGGHFGAYPYRPPLNEQPSASLKPVYEDTQENTQSATYRPSVVGGSLGHVVGVAPARPRPPGGYYQPPAHRPRSLYSNSILGSFVDLFLK